MVNTIKNFLDADDEFKDKVTIHDVIGDSLLFRRVMLKIDRLLQEAEKDKQRVLREQELEELRISLSRVMVELRKDKETIRKDQQELAKDKEQTESLKSKIAQLQQALER